MSEKLKALRGSPKENIRARAARLVSRSAPISSEQHFSKSDAAVVTCAAVLTCQIVIIVLPKATNNPSIAQTMQHEMIVSP
eukprot:COSAG02_NODE_262_length_26647_cov_21.607240_10_plen_81_part_00